MHEIYAGWIGRATVRIILAAGLLAGFVPSTLAAPTFGAGPAGRPQPVITSPQPAVLITHGPRTRRVVALTFDDGYNPAACGALVDELVALRTPATFFPNSVHVVAAPRLWRRIAALGFPIGNHTATHPFLPGLSYKMQHAQIWTSRMWTERVIGGPSLSVFRPPYGAYNRTTLLAAHATGYPIVLNWDVSFADSSRRPNGRPWPTSSYVRAASKGRNGSVILGHCGSRIDLAALSGVVAGYRARGFTFVTVPELLGLPGAKPMHFPAPPPPPPGRPPGPVPL
jgi:peptidoglycan-N-acetylglucosamine deacetylase